jgi:hypothetical protein
VEVERIRCRIRMKAKEEAVGDGAKAAKGVNNEGYQKGITFVQCMNYHFTIYKSRGGVDTWATKLCFFCFLKVFDDGNHIGGVTNRLRRKGICNTRNVDSSFCKGQKRRRHICWDKVKL